MCVSTRERNQFPSVLLQPLGDLSVFRISDLRAPSVHSPAVGDSMSRVKGIQKALEWKHEDDN
jgi:hypothetical protein